MALIGMPRTLVEGNRLSRDDWRYGGRIPNRNVSNFLKVCKILYYNVEILKENSSFFSLFLLFVNIQSNFCLIFHPIRMPVTLERTWNLFWISYLSNPISNVKDLFRPYLTRLINFCKTQLDIPNPGKLKLFVFF